MMEDMQSQDLVQKFTVMMQELEQRQEVLQKKTEQRHQQALEEIKALLTGISFGNMKIANNMTQGESTKAREDPLEDLKNLKQEFTLQDYWNSFNQLYSKARIQEEKVLNFFLSGLVDELQLAVRMFKPRTLSEAYSLARLQEEMVERDGAAAREDGAGRSNRLSILRFWTEQQLHTRQEERREE
ncbi:hypothetical protein GH714_037773 [Hevea brasiliensis]|uniref:Retrotransposon gag domain-containing protein n=1 Tax=Hevea brasiliensis TaxID=3981 RepID=A0A6A6KAQ1_HEVBR|nr:hypothetical protein GH714_037600 [Hevea brasiliensis]KAF2285078.1 hypothetical protein GH714_037773 [Hevea brasiliensis]